MMQSLPYKKSPFISISEFFENKKLEFKASSYQVKLSCLFMGLGQLFYKQFIKGILYLLTEIAMIAFMVLKGFSMIEGFFTLGLVAPDPILGIKGDNSVVFLIMGIFAWMIVAIFLVLYAANIKDCYKIYLLKSEGKEIPNFIKAFKAFVDKDFYKIMLFVPIVLVLIFNVTPIIFMICIAFTDYGVSTEAVDSNLINWCGFYSFEKLFTASNIGKTLGKVFLWNIVWAVSSTLVNYFLGLGLALLLNKKIVKCKWLWRAFPILAYAIPGFITISAFRYMFTNGGPINNMLMNWFGLKQPIDFLGLNSKWYSRFIGLGINAWLSIPTTMLLATGILSNMNTSCYEAARIDGASPRKQFFDLTLPFVVFATTPTLISQFVGNFNNFGIFFYLRGDILTDGYFYASDTDLLINWLYKLSIDKGKYYIGGAVSLIIFVFTASISLMVYVRSQAYKKEDTYR